MSNTIPNRHSLNCANQLDDLYTESIPSTFDNCDPINRYNRQVNHPSLTNYYNDIEYKNLPSTNNFSITDHSSDQYLPIGRSDHPLDIHISEDQ